MPVHLQYTPLERLTIRKPADRIRYLRSQCSGRTVIDLGALDETAFTSKQGKGSWVHEEIASVAKQVIGLDSSSKIPPEGLRTGPRSVIFRGTVEDLPDLLRSHACEPDVITAGELIEHLPNPLEFLRTLHQQPKLRGKTLLITTPNATALHNVVIGMTRRESTHPDHLCILSFKTLNTLFMRSGFTDWTLIPYYARFTEMHARSRGPLRGMVMASERLINLAEWVFPLLSFGWIANVRI